MNNQYDEMKKLLNITRNKLGRNNLKESRENLVRAGIIKEQEEQINIAQDSENEMELENNNQEDKQKTYRISGGTITIHGKDKQQLDLSTDEKSAFQETMNEFVDEVSDLTDFGTLNLYENNVDWSGKIIDFDLEFYFSIGETSGVYINGDMIKLDDKLVELINKLTNFYEKFKSKWSRIVSQRKNTN
jgi:hypothetical protein